ncbi:peptidylprolyl isomerase [Pontixanthobacter gangjinensis]|uniref:peptidylprolyl isomerase n=1 Tax=Pontixanthobacter gangjinensis TaxID=1028742 RepID=A0A6I4SK48_9SPHN|nr:peptidylprolyl isomerase [Pontixanthobacter gangjinensis]MXO56014.1 peptidyl-prolyl cis-trans isomerase [Pontixanthobacter gangjinensis]
MTFKNWAREPLVHFLIAGAILFAFFAWKGEPADPTSREITVTREDQARLALGWEQTMSRSPTDAELDSLIQTWLREEVLYREALRLGLDRDDAVVRKRLANKMDFLATSIAETAKPSDTTLETWLADNPQRFAPDTDYSFDQLYFSEKDAAEAALSQLPEMTEWQGMGEVISLPTTSKMSGSGEIERRFGVIFLERLMALQPDGEWVGPIPSGFGWHVVRLRQRNAGEVPPLADIRERAENDWRAQTLETRREDAYQLLRDAYQVTIEE